MSIASLCWRRARFGLAVGRRVRCSISTTSPLFAVPADVDGHCPAGGGLVLGPAIGGHTHDLYSYQLRRWFEWCEGNGQPHLSCLSGWRSVVIRSTPAGSMSAETADA